MSAPTSPAPAARSEHERFELLCLVGLTCTALFLTKLFIAGRDLDAEELPPRIWHGWGPASLGRVWLCCAEDFAVGLGCLLAAGLALRLTPGPRGRRVVRVAAHLAAALAVCYMVVNAEVYHVLRRFLTYALFRLGGGLSPEQSVRDAATPALKLAVALVPLLTLAAHLALVRWVPGGWRRRALGCCRPAVALALLLALAAVAQNARAGLFADEPGDFARNPHLLLARSCFLRVGFGDLADAEADFADFEPGRPGHGLALGRRPTNVILIVLESASAVYLEDYGSPLPTTPNLCRLQGRGVTFDHFYATATHTIASALPLHAAVYNDPQRWSTVEHYPGLEVPSAAAWLRQRGYRTYFLGAGGSGVWDYNNLAARFLCRGFDLARTGHRLWSGGGAWAFSEGGYTDGPLFADARRCLDDARGRPFFLMLWNYDTHYPFHPGDEPELDLDDGLVPPSARGPERAAPFRRYVRSLRNVDALIGRLADELEERGLADDTLLVVTADHGEAFGQHGFFAHGQALYEEDVRVPLVFVSPRLAALGPRNATLGSHVDLWPTITDVCGLPADPRWQGKSLFADAPADERRAYFGRAGSLGVRQGRYKYVWDYEDGREYLFDLESDPAERHNLARRHPDFCLAQRRRLRDWTVFQAAYVKERLTPGER